MNIFTNTLITTATLALLSSAAAFAGAPQTLDSSGAQVSGESTNVRALAVTMSDGSRHVYVPASLAKGRSFENATVVDASASITYRANVAVDWAENEFGGQWRTVNEHLTDKGPF